ncbi:MAG: hypothetical protein PHX79_08925 [Sphaerochaetaceae bacterium]|jgi:hypothetical protein|nr:hypothetical protein [Sphaerochaetaceae bacterium]
MVCGLGIEELVILNTLYGNRCVRSNRSFNFGQVASAFRAKFKKDPNDLAKGLIKKGYLASVPKKDTKYYISDLPRTCYALSQHGYNATAGRILTTRVHKL